MKKKIGNFFLALLVPVIYFAAMIIVQIIVSIVWAIISAVTGKSIDAIMEYNNLMIITAISMVGGIIITFVYVKLVFKIPLFDKHRINILMILLSLVIGVSAGYFAGNLPELLFPNGKPAVNAVTEDFSIMTVITAAILAPICEELVFRKYMLDAGKKRGLSAILMIIVSSLAFAIAHDPTSIIYITATAILGTTFAICYHKSGVIIYCMLMHFANNGLACIVTWAEHNTDAAEAAVEAEMTTSQSIIFTVVCFAVLAVSMFAFCKLAKKNKKDDNKCDIVNVQSLELV